MAASLPAEGIQQLIQAHLDYVGKLSLLHLHNMTESPKNPEWNLLSQYLPTVNLNPNAADYGVETADLTYDYGSALDEISFTDLKHIVNSLLEEGNHA